eukprot:GFUD01036912.1.p1 GENE.GFUD01036912.1~~GFUD01036912.1.p1  ORF type:complete len:874 (+),score=241.55 GFUD01036912.1:57-2678(+)
MSLPPDLPHCEVGEDTLSSIDGSSMIGSSVSKYITDSEESSTDSEEEEEAEPKLKYERLSADLKAILKKDVASCLAVHNKFLILGSHWGVIHLLDAMGNSLPSRQAQAHTITVNQVSVDHAGEYYASCSDDGRVVVTGLYTDENTHNFNMEKPVKSIAIDPIYARANSGKRFMTGVEDKLILHEKVIFSRYKQDILCQGEGSVCNIKWRGRFAAWVTDKGVRVYDVVEEKTISLIQKPPNCPANQSCPWRIGWSDQFSLVVSFGDTVKSCTVKKRTTRGENVPEYCVEVVHQFTLDCWVCGLARLDDLLVVLATPKKIHKDGKQKRPQPIVFDPADSYRLVSTDLLSIRGHEEHKPKDYQLECLTDDKHYFIMSPKDIVLGKPRDQDDHIEWLLDHKEFEVALEQSLKQQKYLKKYSYLGIGRKYLDFLLKSEQFNEAGVLCTKILGRDKKLWQEEIFKFAQLKQLKVIAPHLPCGDVRLDPAVYEMVLYDFLKTDVEGFLNFIRLWSSDLYNLSAVVNVVIEQLLIQPDNATLLRSLATLYSFQRKYDKAMAMYLKLGHRDVFTLIRQHRLFKAIHDKILALLDLDQQASLELFLDYQAELPPDLICTKLASNQRQMFLYLDALYTQDKGSCPGKYHGHLVRLYATYAPGKLLKFLKKSDEYPMAEALDECTMRGMTPEKIYLLARMGNTRAALELIMQELVDVEQAVEFCKEHDDSELWDDLIRYSLDKPPFIIVLLNNVGTHIDPRMLVERIEPGLEIPGLRASLIQILRDYKLQVSLQEGCKKILVSDCYSLLCRRVRSAAKGLHVTSTAVCPVCGVGVLCSNPDTMQDLVVLNCRHAYHAACLVGGRDCSVCCQAGQYNTHSTYYYKE